MDSLKYILLSSAILFAQALSFAQTPAEKAAFERVVSSARSMKTMTADFTETKQLKMLSDAVVTTGKLWYKAPSYMRWEYDSRNYGVYNPKGGYMVKNGQRDGAMSRGFAQTGRMVTQLMGNLSEDIKDYSISYKTAGKNLEVTAIPVSPRMKGFVESIVMKFDIATCQIRSFEMHSQSGVTTIVFSGMKTDSDIDSQLFN